MVGSVVHSVPKTLLLDRTNVVATLDWGGRCLNLVIEVLVVSMGEAVVQMAGENQAVELEAERLACHRSPKVFV